MKLIENQLSKQAGSGLKVETCKIYKQGHVAKIWLGIQLSKDFLEGYEFDRLIGVIDKFTGSLILYKITNKAEFEKAFRYASNIRGEVSDILSEKVNLDDKPNR